MILEKNLLLRNGILFLFIFFTVFMGIKETSHFIHIIINKSSSLPYKLFFHFPKKKPSKGNYTLFFSPWYGEVLIKKIIGKEGDVLSYDKEGRLLVGSYRVGFPKPYNHHGRALTPIKKRVIPQGHVFLYAPHPLSFDSRYLELGLVPLTSLQGTAYPIKGYCHD